MADNKIKANLDILYNVNYSYNDRYKLSYLRPSQWSRISNAISELRRVQEINGDEARLLSDIFNVQFNNFKKIKELIYQEPRRAAQAFIGNKNIRTFIFKRDGYRCLRCNTDLKLQIDHIIPISKGGENKLSNLQTLCGSCNSSKSDNYKDYRNGAR